MDIITWADFEKIDIRTGTITEVSDFPKARNPSYQLKIDFGELGFKKSSAQVVEHYKKEDLICLKIQRKSNSKRKDTKEQVQKKLKMRKRIETAISDIKKLFPRTIHAVTLNGFLIKLILFVFGLQINKITN